MGPVTDEVLDRLWTSLRSWSTHCPVLACAGPGTVSQVGQLIWVVDDDAGSRVLERRLELSGIGVERFNDAEALLMAIGAPPDETVRPGLILMDVMLATSHETLTRTETRDGLATGVALADRMASDSSWAHVPVALVTHSIAKPNSVPPNVIASMSKSEFHELIVHNNSGGPIALTDLIQQLSTRHVAVDQVLEPDRLFGGFLHDVAKPLQSADSQLRLAHDRAERGRSALDAIGEAQRLVKSVLRSIEVYSLLERRPSATELTSPALVAGDLVGLLESAARRSVRSSLRRLPDPHRSLRISPGTLELILAELADSLYLSGANVEWTDLGARVLLYITTPGPAPQLPISGYVRSKLDISLHLDPTAVDFTIPWQ